MKRQGMTVTLKELYKLVEELENEFDDGSPCYSTDDNRKFQINIINRTPRCSDTWEIESNLQQCPTVRVEKKEGGHAPCLHNQPRNFCKAKQLDEDGISSLELNDDLDS